MQKLASGQSLADIAKAQNKSVDGLKKAILASATKALDQAVKNGVLTQAQAKEGLKMLESRLDDIVNGSLPRMPMGRGGFHLPEGAPDRGGWGMPGATDS